MSRFIRSTAITLAVLSGGAELRAHTLPILPKLCATKGRCQIVGAVFFEEFEGQGMVRGWPEKPAGVAQNCIIYDNEKACRCLVYDNRIAGVVVLQTRA
jgi:hypothetical protein